MYITRQSHCCDGISVDLINGTASVLFTNGSVYDYKNVSRRAILNLMINPNMSLGFWINTNLVHTNRTTSSQRYAPFPQAMLA